MPFTPPKWFPSHSALRRAYDVLSLIVCVTAWISVVATAIYYVIHFAQRFPYADDWNMVVPVLARVQRFDIGWLWSQYNEHRIFIPRLAFVALGRIDHGDFRAPVLLNVALLAVMSALFLVAARRRRGTTSLSDCFFPFMLLHLLQSSVFWGAQFQFVSSSFLFCIAVFVIVFSERLSVARLVVIAVVSVLLPLCGGNGLALAPPLAAWLFVHGLYRLRRGERAESIVALSGSLAVVALSIGYLIGWDAGKHPWEDPHLATAAPVALQFAAAGFGPDLALLWPAGGVVIGVLAVYAVGVLIRGVTREGCDGRAFALLVLVLALALLAATVGWSRAARRWPLFLEYHYAPLALPIPCVLYLVSLCYGTHGPRRIGAIARWSLLVLAGAVYYDSVPRGAHPHVAEMTAFAADIATGASAHDLVARHIHLLASSDSPDERATIERGLQGLFDAGYYRGH